MIQKVGTIEEVEGFLERYKDKHGGVYALIIAIDSDGYPCAVASDDFPKKVCARFTSALNGVLRRIANGEGLH